MSPRVLVIGAVNVDVVVTADRLPGPGETVVGPSAHQHGGGKGANAAVAAARAGAEVRYCGAVGADATGRTALAELSKEDIDITDVAVLDGVTTGVALIVVDAAGENQIAVGAGANAAVTPEQVRAAVARAAGWAGYVLVSTEISPVAVVAGVEAAAQCGLPCVLNPAPVTAGVVDLLAEVAVLTPNASELADLHRLAVDERQASVRDMASALAKTTETTVVVTLGGDGVLVVQPDGLVTRLPVLQIDRVADTTGAGDTFNGAFVTALAAGESVVSAGVRGVAAATLSVRQIGARAGMPRAAEIEAVLSKSHRRAFRHARGRNVYIAAPGAARQ